MKIIFPYIWKAMPWAGMLIFAWLWFSSWSAGVGFNYMEQSYSELESSHENVKKFIVKRKDFSSDYQAFEGLKMIREEQYNGKYYPFLATTIGMVRFDSSGSIQQVCGTEFDISNCAENIGDQTKETQQ